MMNIRGERRDGGNDARWAGRSRRSEEAGRRWCLVVEEGGRERRFRSSFFFFFFPLYTHPVSGRTLNGGEGVDRARRRRRRRGGGSDGEDGQADGGDVG